VFIDLSNDGMEATTSDSLGLSTATTSIQVSYLKTGTGGAVTATPATISVGNGTSYANTVQGLMSAINDSGLGLTATFGTATSAGTAAVATAKASLDGGGSGSDTGIIISGQNVGTGTSAGEIGSLTVGGTALDPLAGTLNVTGSDGTSHTITLGQADSTDNITNLAATINANNYGITASVSGGTLTFTSASATASVSGTNLMDSVTAVDATAPATAGATAPLGNVAGTIGTLTVGNASDILTGGTISVTGQSGTLKTFTLGTAGTTDNLTNLAKTINDWSSTAAGAGVTASVTGGVMTLTSAGGGAGAVQTALTSTTLTSDTVAAATSVTLAGTPTIATASVSTLGTLTLGGVGDSVSDVLNGTLTIGANSITLGGAGTTDTLQDLAKTIDSSNYGVTATYSQTSKNIVFTSSNAALTLSYTKATGSVSGDQTIGTGTVTYAAATPVTTAEDYYSIGISSTTGISDKSTAVGGIPTYGGTLNTGITTDTDSANGIAAISYTDAAGESLSATDLTTQADAQSALNKLNVAISDVAAQDGYIGAQINTLNSISQVMSTQQENVVSAQNAIQATDYASATSSMSKYEILSQTGIAALAQANSVQQEVTKLLQ
jgi:flagellin